ncbi:hypothetical protein [Kitasatospora sp. NPDC050543]|uniref:hypothetical protein n=1 Tax=Kitasatospora sp. NPDC050543 TaxID=3364054 RepID=UPI0037A626EE
MSPQAPAGPRRPGPARLLRLPRRRWARWALGVTAVLVVVAVGLWNLPLAGQWRAERQPRDLLLAEPGGGREWRVLGDGSPQSPQLRGLDQRWGRSWQEGAHSSEGRADQVFERVNRMDSPTWAWLLFRGGADPAERAGKFYDVARLDAAALAPHADERRFSCARSSVAEGACTRWWVWLRYGQYLVELEAAPVGDPHAEPPAWLADTVARVDGAMAATA